MTTFCIAFYESYLSLQYAAEPPPHVQHLIIQWFFIRHHIIDPPPFPKNKDISREKSGDRSHHILSEVCYAKKQQTDSSLLSATVTRCGSKVNSDTSVKPRIQAVWVKYERQRDEP